MNIELKNLNEIDPAQLAYYANDLRVSQYLRNTFPYPYTINDALSFIQFSIQHQHLDFAIVVNDQCVGCISASLQKDIYQHNCEIGYWLGYEYWNQGIMGHVLDMFIPYLFENDSIHKIYAEVYEDNHASACLLEKKGFIKEGVLKQHLYKNNRYYNAVIYSLFKRRKENDSSINTK